MKRDASQTPRSVNLGFEDDCVILPIESILPLRALSKSAKSSRKYRQIVAATASRALTPCPAMAKSRIEMGTGALPARVPMIWEVTSTTPNNWRRAQDSPSAAECPRPADGFA